MGANALEEADLTQDTNEPQPEASAPEITALIPAEPEIIEGEVIEIAPPETAADYTPPKQKPYWLLVPFTLLVCFSILSVSLVLPILTPSATVIIIPVEHTIITTSTIQVHGRPLPTFTLSQSQTTPATGKRHQNATRAQGTITFYNGLFTSQTISAGTILTGANGVQITTDQPAIIPAGNPPSYGQVTISAHALLAGTSGNIPAYDINNACCTTSVLAKNTTAFQGGAAARDFIIVTKSDLEAAEAVIKATLEKSERAALNAQLNIGEALITPTCTPTTTSNHRPGDQIKEVTVTVSETCSAVAYPDLDVYQDATQLLTANAKQTLGVNYIPLGNIQINIIHATITDQSRGIATLTVKLDATYIYRITEGQRAKLNTLIAGKTKAQTLHTLLRIPGIQGASIRFTGGDTLPHDPNHITISIVYGVVSPSL